MRFPSGARQRVLLLAVFSLLLAACASAPEETAVPAPAVANPAALAPPTTSTTAAPATTEPDPSSSATLEPTTETETGTETETETGGEAEADLDRESAANEGDETGATTTTTQAPVASQLLDFSTDTSPADDAFANLLDETTLSFVMITATEAEFGNASSLQRGIWISGVGSETSIVLELDEDSTALVETTLAAEGTPTAGLSNAFSTGFRYRFFDDDLVWAKVADQPWTAADPVTSGLDVFEPTGDAATYLEPFVNAIVGVAPGEPRGDGSIRYPLQVDADAFVPLVAQPQTAQNIYDQGWDGLSGETIDGEIVLSSDGDIIAVGVDQTAWWEAGWDVAGVADLLDGTNVSWTMTIDSSPQTLEVPCANPAPSTDPELGETLVCSN